MEDFPIILHSMAIDNLNIPIDEIVRYACMGQPTLNNEDRDILYNGATNAAKQLKKVITCRGVYRCFPVLDVSNGTANLGFATVNSKHLINHIEGCSHIILMAVTLGVGVDRIISKKSATSAGEGFLFSCAGSAAAEAYIDSMCEELIEKFDTKGYNLTERFSAGYGNFSISYQNEILRALNAPKNIGLTLSEGYLMIPTKSITAVVGVHSKR